MTTEDRIIAEKDARRLLKKQFGAECQLISFRADKYFELETRIGGVPFQSYSCSSLQKAIDSLIEAFRDWMQYPRPVNAKIEIVSECPIEFEIA